jgi:hypothetical protein
MKLSNRGAGVLLARVVHVCTRCWLAARMAVWLCELPVLIRVVPLPALLRRISSDASAAVADSAWHPDDVASVASRVCALPMFRTRAFPRSCLRRSLVLFRALTTMGYPATIHFGVRKQGDAFEGHSWVSLQGRPLAETASVKAFSSLYSFEG